MAKEIDKNSRVDTIRMSMGHALITGNIPPHLQGGKLNLGLAQPQDMEKLGWFSDPPSFTQYYPEVTPEDLMPKEEDYVYPLYRMLSEVTVRPSNPIFFPKSVLKASMNKLVSQTVYPDHQAITGNGLGVVMEVYYQEAYNIEGYGVVPAGINGVLRIDGKSHPTIARGTMENPPTNHSTSVTVAFKWEKSHPEMDDDTFWVKMGSRDSKGKLIQRIASEIINYQELSLVPHGADPFAKRLDSSGKLLSPGLAFQREQLSLSPGETEKDKFISFSYKDIDSLVLQPTIPLLNNKNTSNMYEEERGDTLINVLMALPNSTEIFGENITRDTILAWVLKTPKEVERLTEEVTNLTTQVETLKLDNQKKTEELAKVGDFKKSHEALVASERVEAIRVVTLATGTPNTSLVEVINNGSYEVVHGLVVDFTKLVDEKYPMKCKSCGATHSLSRGDGTPSSDDSGKHQEQLEASIKKLRPKSIFTKN